MGTEIERKYLVVNDAWRSWVTRSLDCRQGYLSSKKECTIRVRILDDQGFLTLKGSRAGLTRQEFEYSIPLEDAQQILSSCCHTDPILKRRHFLTFLGKEWIVDEFSGANHGLIVTEIELADENESFPRPAWVGREVSLDLRYFNANLARNPFSQWPASDSANS